ncbi:putative NAD-independent protein deacetylase AcuC [Sulfolobales Virus YNP2]|uniref:putative NAD-independent protein deacetylase AcuC n=1 Tax=Sulfolobales Virus YNP2 TaxID=1732180 RepID=UPI0007062670|nr:putative NAD-independent protein deacetylase AcuC [Sulfolobales Virus YNP2]ALG97189.1 putative NAD-independent protein deacetylase AcuC [Sulfolobales Virus YNP2]
MFYRPRFTYIRAATDQEHAREAAANEEWRKRLIFGWNPFNTISSFFSEIANTIRNIENTRTVAPSHIERLPWRIRYVGSSYYHPPSPAREIIQRVIVPPRPITLVIWPSSNRRNNETNYVENERLFALAQSEEENQDYNQPKLEWRLGFPKPETFYHKPRPEYNVPPRPLWIKKLSGGLIIKPETYYHSADRPFIVNPIPPLQNNENRGTSTSQNPQPAMIVANAATSQSSQPSQPSNPFSAIGSFFSGLASAVTSGASTIASGISNAIQSVTGATTSQSSQPRTNNAIENARFGPIGGQPTTSAMTSQGSQSGNPLGSFFSGLTSGIENVWNTEINVAKEAGSAVTGALSTAGNAISNALSAANNAIQNAYASAYGIQTPQQQEKQLQQQLNQINQEKQKYQQQLNQVNAYIQQTEQNLQQAQQYQAQANQAQQQLQQELSQVNAYIQQTEQNLQQAQQYQAQAEQLLQQNPNNPQLQSYLQKLQQYIQQNQQNLAQYEQAQQQLQQELNQVNAYIQQNQQYIQKTSQNLVQLEQDRSQLQQGIAQLNQAQQQLQQGIAQLQNQHINPFQQFFNDVADVSALVGYYGTEYLGGAGEELAHLVQGKGLENFNQAIAQFNAAGGQNIARAVGDVTEVALPAIATAVVAPELLPAVLIGEGASVGIGEAVSKLTTGQWQSLPEVLQEANEGGVLSALGEAGGLALESGLAKGAGALTKLLTGSEDLASKVSGLTPLWRATGGALTNVATQLPFSQNPEQLAIAGIIGGLAGGLGPGIAGKLMSKIDEIRGTGGVAELETLTSPLTGETTEAWKITLPSGDSIHLVPKTTFGEGDINEFVNAYEGRTTLATHVTPVRSFLEGVENGEVPVMPSKPPSPESEWAWRGPGNFRSLYLSPGEGESEGVALTAYTGLKDTKPGVPEFRLGRSSVREALYRFLHPFDTGGIIGVKTEAELIEPPKELVDYILTKKAEYLANGVNPKWVNNLVVEDVLKDPYYGPMFREYINDVLTYSAKTGKPVIDPEGLLGISHERQIELAPGAKLRGTGEVYNIWVRQTPELLRNLPGPLRDILSDWYRLKYVGAEIIPGEPTNLFEDQQQNSGGAGQSGGYRITEPIPEPTGRITEPIPEPTGRITEPIPEPTGRITEPIPEPTGRITEPIPEPTGRITEPIPEPTGRITEPIPEPTGRITEPIPEPTTEYTPPPPTNNTPPPPQYTPPPPTNNTPPPPQYTPPPLISSLYYVESSSEEPLLIGPPPLVPSTMPGGFGGGGGNNLEISGMAGEVIRL